jgi:hypothetical protein
MNFANAFILLLGAGAAWLGVAALVQKRSKHRHDRDDRSSNSAS